MLYFAVSWDSILKFKSMCSTNYAEKEDIYQLGVILLEVITGRQIASSSEVDQLKDEVSITTSVLYNDCSSYMINVFVNVVKIELNQPVEPRISYVAV